MSELKEKIKQACEHNGIRIIDFSEFKVNDRPQGLICQFEHGTTSLVRGEHFNFRLDIVKELKSKRYLVQVYDVNQERINAIIGSLKRQALKGDL